MGVLLVCAVGGLGWPDEARACSLAPGIARALPEAGQPLPSGSRLLLRGSFSADELTVTVDDQPATLRLDETFPRGSESMGAYTIEPTPAEGATVVLEDCSVELPECGTWTWTVSAADATAPAAAEALEFGIYDHVDIDTRGDSCSNGEVYGATLYIEATLPAEDGPGAERQALVEVVDVERDTVVEQRLRDVPREGGPLDVVVGLESMDVSRPLDGRYCVQVTVLDLAGQRAETESSCSPHTVLTDPDQGEPVQDVALPEEPDWDAVEDDEGALDREGCACATTGEPSSPAALLGLGLLALGLRRRRWA